MRNFRGILCSTSGHEQIARLPQSQTLMISGWYPENQIFYREATETQLSE
jgi:hypothetical protein